MKKNYINDGKDCYVLTGYRDDQAVEFEPNEFWILNLFSIVLSEPNESSYEKQYLILEYPSYTEIEMNGKINDCIWSVPYLACLLKKSGAKRYTTVKEIKKFYEEQLKLNQQLIGELENYRFYHMGISNYEKTEGPHYIEYKKSPRQPDKWKCYYIQEYYISEIDSLGLINLVDVEGLHAYRYFSLDWIERREILPNRFLGKRFSSNIYRMLTQSQSNIIQYSNPISKDMLTYSLSGYAFIFDIIGFTKIFNHINNSLGTLNSSGLDIAHSFVAQISEIITSHLHEVDITQYKIEGDGVTGTLPVYDSREKRECLSILLEVAESIQSDINLLLSRLNITVNIRGSIIYGQYLYGKISGLSTHKQNFAGDLMIRLSRSDQFLKELIGERDLKKTVFGFDKSIVDEYDSTVTMHTFSKYLEKQDKYRDTTIDIAVYTK